MNRLAQSSVLFSIRCLSLAEFLRHVSSVEKERKKQRSVTTTAPTTPTPTRCRPSRSTSSSTCSQSRERSISPHSSISSRCERPSSEPTVRSNGRAEFARSGCAKQTETAYPRLSVPFICSCYFSHLFVLLCLRCLCLRCLYMQSCFALLP